MTDLIGKRKIGPTRCDDKFSFRPAAGTDCPASADPAWRQPAAGLGRRDRRARRPDVRELPDLLRPAICWCSTIPGSSRRACSGARPAAVVVNCWWSGAGPRRALVHLRASRPQTGGRLLFDAGFAATVLDRRGELFEIGIEADEALPELLERYGRVPLPPYITHDRPRKIASAIQTIYARRPGAVAAPTAGLHFEQSLLDRLAEQGVEQTFVTLHVGAGTFQPPRVERIAEHAMHAELIEVGTQPASGFKRRARWRTVVAVGTTVVRALETAAGDHDLPGPGAATPGSSSIRAIGFAAWMR